MRRRGTNDERRLVTQVAELEARVRALEKKKRPAPAAAAKPVRRRGPPRPTCPGCLQELPPGRRGQACVWCGFRFDAVPPIPPRKKR